MFYDDGIEDEECIHPGIECEYNTDEEGNPECPCRGDCCAIDDIGFQPLGEEEDGFI